MIKVFAKGIDISSWQGDVDFQKVKAAGYSFVIIKAGQFMGQMKSFREKYLPAALNAGMDWGAYWWSDAVTVADAKAEARCFLQAVDGLKPTYPLFMDQEYNSPPAKLGPGSNAKQQRTDFIKAFLDTLQNAGYYAALYTSTDWLRNWVYDSQLNAYDKWVAQYASRCTYTGDYGMWQRTGSGKVDGISTDVDINECYRDYPGIIKSGGLNGWGSGSQKPQPDKQPADTGSGVVVDAARAVEILKAAGVTSITF